MQFNQKQLEAINHKGNSVVIGAPGTGKTMIIVAKIKQLLKDGIAPETIGIITYGQKSSLLFKNLMQKYLGADSGKIKYGTFNDFAEDELRASNSLEGSFADDSQVRRLLHQAKQATKFPGSITEAEHIIRSFKSQAKKPQATDDYYELFSKYQDLIHNRNWYDRYDCLRQHLISLRNDISQPAKLKYMFIDNAQDMNQIQVLWTLEHANVGARVTLLLDDDLCIFSRAGALGSKVIDAALDSEANFAKINLDTSYRLTKTLQEQAYKIVSLADQRYPKGDLHVLDTESSVEIKEFNSRKQELESIASNLKRFFTDSPQAKAAVITRSDEDVRVISKFFKEEGLEFSEFSRNIWEMPGSIVIVDLLEVLLGTASPASLKNVISTLGVSSKTLDKIFSKGLESKGWLQSGAKIDKSLIDDINEARLVAQIQSMLISYYNLKSKVSFKDIFKALCFELMKQMSAGDKKDALYAIEGVMGFKGDIAQNIHKVRSQDTINPNAKLIIGPVKEFRNFEFDIVFMPFCQANMYPFDYKVLGKKNSVDRRIFFAAMTRSKGTVYISYTGPASSYVKALQR